MAFKYQLGQHLRDRISGFDGVVMCRTEYLHNCARYGLTPRDVDKDGKPRDSIYFDEDQVEPMPEKKAKPYVAKPGATHAPTHGGPAAATQRSGPPVIIESLIGAAALVTASRARERPIRMGVHDIPWLGEQSTGCHRRDHRG